MKPETCTWLWACERYKAGLSVQYWSFTRDKWLNANPWNASSHPDIQWRLAPVKKKQKTDKIATLEKKLLDARRERALKNWAKLKAEALKKVAECFDDYSFTMCTVFSDDDINDVWDELLETGVIKP